MDKLDALALLVVMRLQTVHPTPPIDLNTIANKLAVIIARLDQSRRWGA